MFTKNFRTKQEQNYKSNPKGKDFIIGLDIGYSGTKVFYEDGYFCFPSYAKKIEKGMINVPGEKDILYRDNENGEEYMVGYIAQNMMDSNDTNDTDGELYSRKRYGDKRFKITANVAIALATLNKKDSRKIVIQTGLPTSYVDGDTPAIKKAICKSSKFSLKVGGGKWIDFNFNIDPDDVYVMPQPAGTLYSSLITDDGSYVPDAKKILCSSTLILDIGFGTFDFFGIKDRAIVCEESINEIGMRAVLNRTSKKILKNFNEDIRVAALQKNLETGVVNCINEDDMTAEEQPLEPILKEASREIMLDAMERVKSVTNTFRGYQYVIVSGGTGEAWFEDIKKWLSNMNTLTVNPSNKNDGLPFIYSNARGYYLYRYTLNKQQ